MTISDEIRADSPAYAGDEGEPIDSSAMDVVLSVRFDASAARRIVGLAQATGRSPSKLIRDWTLERLFALSPADSHGEGVRAIGEATTAYTTHAEELRQRYRPDRVELLFVGESAPAGGTFFYQADSNLFRATREAFVQALGPMPDREAFLETFRRLNAWLVDVAAAPVNRQRGRPRQQAVDAGLSRLAGVIGETDPTLVIAVKTSLEGAVRRAAALAGFPASRVQVLPFPLYQWREVYVRDLARLIRGASTGEVEGAAPEHGSAAGNRTLHEAIAEVLRGAAGPMPAREVANEIRRRNLFRRPSDGDHPGYQQVLLRARNYPRLFEITRAGLVLRSACDER